MSMLFPSKGPELVGKQCQGTGVRTGRATLTSMAKPSHSRSPPVMAVLWSLTMLLQVVGPLGRPIVVHNSRHNKPICVFPLSFSLIVC